MRCNGEWVANRVDKHQSEAKLNPYGIEENLSSFVRRVGGEKSGKRVDGNEMN
jgi:hypothetical protein